MDRRPFTRLIALCYVALALTLLQSGAAYAKAIRADKDVSYGAADGPKLLLDVYRPDDTQEKRPALVLIHGGGFVGGDKGFYEPLGRSWAAKGYVVFSVNYRLAPASHYPAQVDDVQRAVRWIRAHADDYRVDVKRIGALGDSAGGYLVTMLGLRDTRDNSDTALASYSSRVQCVVDLYGPTDFTIPQASAKVSLDALMLLNAFFGKTQTEAPDLYRDGSPISYVSTNAAPFLILHGTTDPLVPVDQSERLYDALKLAGIETKLALFYKTGHAFLNPGDPREVGAMAEEFFGRYLKP